MDAAEKIIAENGFRALTMDQVAKEADVAKGTVYLYFKNKNSLCAAVNAKLNKELNQIVKRRWTFARQVLKRSWLLELELLSSPQKSTEMECARRALSNEI